MENLKDKPVFRHVDRDPDYKRLQAFALIAKHRHKFSSCVFVKRTTGQVRKMHFRYDPDEEDGISIKSDAEYAFKRGLLLVQDWTLREARYINLDGLLFLKVGGSVHIFPPDAGPPSPSDVYPDEAHQVEEAKREVY